MKAVISKKFETFFRLFLMFSEEYSSHSGANGPYHMDDAAPPVNRYESKGHRDRGDRGNRDRGERGDRDGGNVYQASTQIPEPVKNFLLVFQHALREHNVNQIQNIYETGT